MCNPTVTSSSSLHLQRLSHRGESSCASDSMPTISKVVVEILFEKLEQLSASGHTVFRVKSVTQDKYLQDKGFKAASSNPLLMLEIRESLASSSLHIFRVEYWGGVSNFKL